MSETENPTAPTASLEEVFEILASELPKIDVELGREPGTTQMVRQTDRYGNAGSIVHLAIPEGKSRDICVLDLAYPSPRNQRAIANIREAVDDLKALLPRSPIFAQALADIRNAQWAEPIYIEGQKPAPGQRILTTVGAGYALEVNDAERSVRITTHSGSGVYAISPAEASALYEALNERPELRALTREHHLTFAQKMEAFVRLVKPAAGVDSQTFSELVGGGAEPGPALPISSEVLSDSLRRASDIIARTEARLADEGVRAELKRFGWLPPEEVEALRARLAHDEQQAESERAEHVAMLNAAATTEERAKE